MLARTQAHRITAGLVLATLAVVSFAPAAHAGRSHGRKYKRVDVAPSCVERVVYTPASRVVVRQSSAGPVIAGLVGGFLLGTAVANAHTHATVHYNDYSPAPHPAYYYYDPVCQVRYDSFDHARTHSAYHSGPRVVQVIEVNGGACVETYRWVGGSWRYYAGNHWNG